MSFDPVPTTVGLAHLIFEIEGGQSYALYAYRGASPEEISYFGSQELRKMPS